MFRSNLPVTDTGFHDRTDELERLLEAFDSLREGAPRWLAIIGPRKVGKTSLLLEAARRTRSGIAFAMVDAFEFEPLDLEVFRVLAVRALDALVGDEAGESLARQLHDPTAFRALLHRAPSLDKLDKTLRASLDRLPDEPASANSVRRWLQLPEELCRALERRLLLAIDEVQELSSLTRLRFSPYPVMRAIWQRHQHVAYVISGSSPTMLRELVTSKDSPFFMHFTLFELGVFSREDAVKLLVGASPPGRRISREVARRVVEVMGTHPFYLQMAGEALTGGAEPPSLDSLKAVLQSLVFSRTGRLGLFFEREHVRAVGNSSTTAAALSAVARLGPLRLSDVARAIGSSAPATKEYLRRLGDVVRRDEEQRYRVSDPLFGAWVRWREPEGTAVPMTLIGNEAEKAVAERLARMGFDLIYQSKASRGAFDLLALRGAAQLGLQVKHGAPPVRFSKSEWHRMQADAARFGWKWAVAVAGNDGEVTLLDPARAIIGKQVRLDETARIANALRWLDDG